MPRRYASMARIIWFPTLYLARPLLARTLIQRCQPSVVSSARAASSMRSRSALRRASRSSSVRGRRLKRLAIVGSVRVGARPRWRADPSPSARPPGRATVGWRVGPPAGDTGLRGLVDVLLELVADAVVGLRLGGLARGAVLFARGDLCLVVGGVGALDGLLELRQRNGHVRAGDLLERLGGDVSVRAPAAGGHPLARRDDEPRGVLLGGDHRQRAAVELAGGLGAVDELPQPRDGGFGVAVVAVVDANAAAGAVLADLGDLGAQLVDHEASAPGGDAGDSLAGLRVGRVVVVGAQQRVDEEPRDVDVRRVDAGEVVDQRVPEVEVGAVRLIGELAQLGVTLALGDGDRVDWLLGRAGGLLVLGGRGRLGVELVVGALDRGLDELAVQRTVDDDRPAALKLDQHAGRSGLVDVLVGETDLRRSVGVAIELLVQLRGPLVELLGLLPQPQLG